VALPEETDWMSYGDGDATFRACGGERGVRALVESFYAHMDALPEARCVRRLHAPDLALSIDKLTCFLVGWTGGPRRYAETFGPIQIPRVHRHLPIGTAERDAWLSCMRHALDDQAYPGDLKRYLLEQLGIPAERVRQAARAHRSRGGEAVDRGGAPPHR
jgi:hemoglobin